MMIETQQEAVEKGMESPQNLCMAAGMDQRDMVSEEQNRTETKRINYQSQYTTPFDYTVERLLLCNTVSFYTSPGLSGSAYKS